MKRARVWLIGVLGLCFWMLVSASGAAAQTPMRFDIPAQPLNKALLVFGETSGYSVLVPVSLSASRHANAVHGHFEPEVALDMLLKNTGLGIKYSGYQAFTLIEAVVPPAIVDKARGQTAAMTASHAAILQKTITRTLCQARIKEFGYTRIAFQLWLGSKGNIEDVRLLTSSGIAEHDQLLIGTLKNMQVSGALPHDFPQPITMLLSPNGNPEEDCRPYLDNAG